MNEQFKESTETVYSDFTRSTLHRGDFLKQIVKRLKKDARHSNWPLQDNTIILIRDGRLSTQVLKKLLELHFTPPLQIQEVTACADVQGAVLNSDCLEEYIQQRLDVFTKQKPLEQLQDNTLTPLRVVTAHEINKLGEIYGLEGTPPKPTEDFLKKLQEKYDQTKTSLLKSFLFLQDLLNERKTSEKNT